MRHFLAVLATVALAVASASAQSYTVRESRFGCGRITELTLAPAKAPAPMKPPAKVEQPKAVQPNGDVDEAMRDAEAKLVDALRRLNPRYMILGTRGRNAATAGSGYPDECDTPRQPRILHP